MVNPALATQPYQYVLSYSIFTIGLAICQTQKSWGLGVDLNQFLFACNKTWRGVALVCSKHIELKGDMTSTVATVPI